MNQLVPDRLRELWQQVDRQELTAEVFQAEQQRLLDAYRRTWAEALSLDGSSDLEKSLLAELGRYVACDDQEALRARCRRAVDDLRHDWDEGVDRDRRASVERFYDASDTPLYELTLWHTLVDDLSPLAYVVALHYAQRHHCTSYLDFGSGVGSGVILFARHGLAVTAADISGPLLGYGATWTSRYLRRRQDNQASLRGPRHDHRHGRLRASGGSGRYRGRAVARAPAWRVPVRAIRDGVR